MPSAQFQKSYSIAKKKEREERERERERAMNFGVLGT
jgi:hypothetical protein